MTFSAWYLSSQLNLNQINNNNDNKHQTQVSSIYKDSSIRNNINIAVVDLILLNEKEVRNANSDKISTVSNEFFEILKCVPPLNPLKQRNFNLFFANQKGF